MNWDRMAGNQWTDQHKNKVRERWGKLTDDDLNQIGGRREQLIAVLAQRYGWPREQVERQVRDFEQSAGAGDFASTSGGSQGSQGSQGSMGSEEGDEEFAGQSGQSGGQQSGQSQRQPGQSGQFGQSGQSGQRSGQQGQQGQSGQKQPGQQPGQPKYGQGQRDRERRNP
jgi:uncharacterized protein YjbJ (UPF0337 family)